MVILSNEDDVGLVHSRKQINGELLITVSIYFLLVFSYPIPSFLGFPHPRYRILVADVAFVVLLPCDSETSRRHFCLQSYRTDAAVPLYAVFDRPKEFEYRAYIILLMSLTVLVSDSTSSSPQLAVC